jgi:hypothetical protein
MHLSPYESLGRSQRSDLMKAMSFGWTVRRHLDRLHIWTDLYMRGITDSESLNPRSREN